MNPPVRWKRDEKPGLVMIFIGIAALVQVPLIWHATVYVQVLSVELQLIVSLGVTAVLAGAYVLLAEAMYRWAEIASRKKRRKRQKSKMSWIDRLSALARSREDLPPFVGVALLTAVFMMVYFVPFGISDISNLPSWLATLAFLDSLFIYPLAANIAAIVTAVIASYTNYKLR